MPKILHILFLFWGYILCIAQQHPVRITPVMTPPYSLLLPEIAQSSQDKIQLHILMTDLNEPSHQVSLRFKLLSGTSSSVIAQSTPFVNGLPTQNLLPGQPIVLSNLDIRPLFQLQNLAGINPQQYAKPLPQGLYQFCFQVIDQHTRRELSNFSCVPVYLQQYEPPFLVLPKNAEIIQKQNEFQNILFQWMPRQIAPNTQYTFTLKEINDNIRDPHSAFLTARTLWQENTLAPNLFYGIDKTPLITGKRYAWQVKATSANPALPNFSINPNDDTGIYQNNGLSEIFFFDYTEHCALPKFLIAKNQGRGKTQILWSFNQYQPNKQYLVQYRKKDSHKDWAEIKTYAENAFINKLEDLTTYEYRVGASCNQTTDGRVQFAFSDIQTFTTDSKQIQNQNYQCGVMPNIDLANQQLFQGSLGANDTFTAGDFPVTILEAEGQNGIFSGKGYIQVPYLADTKIIVAFQNISINTDRKLINGVLETEYDAEEKNVVEVELFGKLLDDLNGILYKENPTEEDKKRYLDIKNQLDFYISNIDELDIPEEDKQKFKNIQANIFLASLDGLTDEQKENAKNATQEAQNLYQKYEKEVNTLKENGVNYTNPNYNNDPINIDGEDYNLEKLIKRTDAIKRKLKSILKDLSDEEKLILDLPMIEWKLGFKTGGVFILKWLEGKGKSIEIPYSFVDNSPKYKGIDMKNINLLKNIKYFPNPTFRDYTPSPTELLYNIKINSIKNAYNKIMEKMKNGSNFEIGDKNFEVNANGSPTSNDNFIQSFALGTPLGEFTDIGTSLGNFAQRVYIYGNISNNSLYISKIATRYTDIFTFDDSGFWETKVRSQELGCWIDNEDPKKVEVNRYKLPFSSKVCLQNNDFIKLKQKAKEINVHIGKDFFIYTPMKIIENKNIIKNFKISKK